MSASKAKELGLKPMARIVAQATSGIDPAWVMMAPVDAVRQIWKKTGWKNEDVDLYEINEAFSVAAIAVTRELGLDLNKVNVNGGAVALGHPIGASGARILMTLLYEMSRRDVHQALLRSAWAEAMRSGWRWSGKADLRLFAVRSWLLA